MKYLKQFAIIITVSFIGELLHYLIPLPIPASIYGLIIMFSGLKFGFIPYHDVKETSKFLIEIMPLIFIPASVGLLESQELLKPILIPYLLIITISTILVMVVSGRVTQRIVLHDEKKAGKS